MMTIVAGAVCILAGVARLGFVTELLSKPIHYGYIAAIASRRSGRSLWPRRMAGPWCRPRKSAFPRTLRQDADWD